jgi:beta-glucanase (GH16 family)
VDERKNSERNDEYQVEHQRDRGRFFVGPHSLRIEGQVKLPAFLPALRSPTAALSLAFLFGIASSTLASWRLDWSDDFEGNTLDTNKWTFDIGNGSGGWGNRELEYYTSRTTNAYVADGLLHIVAREESFEGFHYTSGKLKTRGLFSTLYGRVEFRAKLPQGVGYWPAIWMMPAKSPYGGWPACGEIDIVENKGRVPNKVMGTLHFGGGNQGHAQSHGPSYTFSGGDSVTNFHVYALEWTTNQIKWYVDNSLYETQSSWWTTGGKYPAPFDSPFYIIMNLAVGGNFDRNPEATTVFPGDMQIDYVRVFHWIPPTEPSLGLR